MRGDQLARQWQLIQLLARSRAGVGVDRLLDELDCPRLVFILPHAAEQRTLMQARVRVRVGD